MEAHELVNRTLSGVTASWYVTVDSGDRELLHVWLQVEGMPLIRCHTLLGLRLDDVPPPSPYEMPELGARVDVEDGTPAPLAALVGAKITGYCTLRSVDDDAEIGLVLHTDKGSVGIADIGDDLALGDWADRGRWSAAGIVEAG